LGRGRERRPRLFSCTTRTRWRRGPDRRSPFERGPQPRDFSRRGVGDAGNYSAFLHRYWGHSHPRTQLTAADGAMGFGVPAAVAAKLAAPERPVVAC
jgi:hypothetical protein